MKRILIALSALLLSAQGFAQKLMTPEQLWSLNRVAVESISPDGKTINYVQRKWDVATEKTLTTYHSVQVNDGTITGRNAEGKKIFQRDAKGWYANESGKLIFSKDHGKSWITLGAMPKDADVVKISPDGQHVAYTKEVAIEKVIGKEKYPDLPKSHALIYDDLNYRHWDTYEDGKYSHLFIAAIGEEGKDIIGQYAYDVPQKPFGGAEDIVWSPDGKHLLYVCKKLAGKDYALSTNTDIYAYEVATGNTVNLTEGRKGYDTHPTFSPDGKYLAYLSMERDGYESDKNVLVAAQWRNGALIGNIKVTGAMDNTVDAFEWSDDSKSFYFISPYRGTEQIFRTMLPNPVQNMRMKPVFTKLTDGAFNVTGIVGQDAKELFVMRTDFNHAAELFAVDKKTGNMRQLSHGNTDTYKDIKMGHSELRMVKTTNGEEMGVWVVYPPDFDPSKKYPTLLYCQGGPQSALSQFYSFRWNFQLMAANGYIVVAPNRHGMPGWGVAWNEQISKDWGGQAMQDYLTAIDEVSKESYVDKNRLAAVGASFGGYSVFMLAGMHNNRFKSFISHCGMFDNRSWYGTTEEMFFANWDLGGPYWDAKNKKQFTDFSPSTNAGKWNTPILIIQGGKDYRVPIEQGQQAFQAAQLQGIKSRFLLLPDENHWVSTPQNGILWQREFFSWLSETLK